MKRIVTIFITVICLFSFVGISCISAERDNYGKIWNGWSEYEKYVYMWGLKDGLLEDPYSTSEVSLLTHPESKVLKEGDRPAGFGYSISEKEKKARWDALFIVITFGSPKYNIEVIRDVATDLYKDPANSYIYISEMCYLAFWKLKGKDIEPILLKLREEAD